MNDFNIIPLKRYWYVASIAESNHVKYRSDFAALHQHECERY